MSARNGPPGKDLSSFPIGKGAFGAWNIANLGGATALNTLVVAANTLYAEPIYTGVGGAIDVVAINVTAGAAGNCRIGLYTIDPATNLPKDKLYDSGNISVAAGGVKQANPALALAPNTLVWICVVFDVAPTIRSIPIAGAGALSLPPAMGTAPTVGLTAPHVFAALPALFDAGGAIAPRSVDIPALAYHYT